MRRSRSWFLSFLLGGLFVATVAGLAAPVEPRFDLINHFRPHLLAGAIGLSLLCVVLGRWRLARWAAAIAGLNLLMALPAFYVMADKTANADETLKIVTFNIWGDNRSYDRVEAFLRKQDADLVFLSEITAPAAPMLEQLSDLYPHQISCAKRRFCHLALLSKQPFAAGEAIDRDDAGPPRIVARLQGDGATLGIVGVHLARPFGRGWQAGEINALIPMLRKVDRPLLVMGDFNATPWSWTLTRLAHGANLRRHGLLGASWPAAGALPPQVLIDHVLTSPGIGSVSIGRGPRLGSDHVPVVAHIAVP